MKQLMAKGEDLTTLSLSQINKKSQSLQKRLRGIMENPNIKGTTIEGPKADMIDAVYKTVKMQRLRMLETLSHETII